MVAERTETNAPPIIEGTPNRVIKGRLSGTNTHIPHIKIPIEEILAKPHNI